MTGQLDEANARRYVKREIVKLLYCYEKELVTTPRLAGTVIAELTISHAGAVTAASARGMNDANVESCIVGVLKDIELPEREGGEVVVRCSLAFRPAPPATKRPSLVELVGSAALRDLFLVLTDRDQSSTLNGI